MFHLISLGSLILSIWERKALFLGIVIQLQANRQEKQHHPINSGMTNEPHHQVQEHALDCIAYCGVFASFLQENRRAAFIYG